MSKKSNVNPGHYKVAGRERQGEEIDQEAQKRILRQNETAREDGTANFIPGGLPVGESSKNQDNKKESTPSRKPEKD